MKSIAVLICFYKNSRFLDRCLDSLEKQTFKDFDILIKDNSNSQELLDLKSRHTFEISDKKGNDYFAEGNNILIRNAISHGYKYVFLLNDDVYLDENALSAFYEKMEKDKKLSVLNGKLNYYEQFINLEIKGDDLKFFHASRFANSNYSRRFYKEGFININPETSLIKSSASVFMPIGEKIPDLYKLQLILETDKKQTIEVKISEFTANLDLDEGKNQLEVETPREIVLKSAFSVVQNAGSALDETYGGYDIGRDGEIDRGQYNTERKLELFCGADAFIRVSDLKKVGLLDSYFKMYYEDSDLSLRFRRLGFNLGYIPNARGRHYHSQSSVEGSDLFIYFAFRNKVAFAIKNLGFKAIYSGYKFLIKEFLFFLLRFLHERDFKSQNYSRLKIAFRIILSLKLNFPILILKRFNIIRIS